MAEEASQAPVRRQGSLSKKAPIVDNFVLLFHDKDGGGAGAPSSDSATSPPDSAEQAFRSSVLDHLERIEELRHQITDKYHAKQLTQEKINVQHFELQHQSRFNALNAQTQQSITINYKRMILLCEKIYSLTAQLQTLYIELADLVETRAEHTTELHRRSRLCASAIYEYNKRAAAA